ncbi:yeats family protein [Dichomitus squalens]|uniref:Protein AF-9 homolog n=1 Tax=Dichomitus squalens TaxID=114155 RepID=A0A4Q9NZA6_9APHY|nr:yeats family protein [Dichomitus squalens]TBU63192.1 yeats family protein [Dichomitus squalens]
MASNDRVRVRGVTIHRPIIYGNTAWVLTPNEREALPSPDHTHRWTVAVRSAASAPDSNEVGGADDLSYFIKRVTFKLHDTYPNPTRNVDKPPFEVSETGWGEFDITIRITFVQESGEKAITFYHHLKLHPWTAPGSGEPEIPTLENALKAGPVHSWQYDEIVFNDPFQSFLNILTAHPPTPLPKVKRRPVPYHIANLASLEASKGGTPEFTQEMEKEEAERLDKALKQIVEDTHKWRNKLIEKENESNKYKKELEAVLQLKSK